MKDKQSNNTKMDKETQTDTRFLGEFGGVSPEDFNRMSRYLDYLRLSGATNMFGAGAYLREAFGVSKPISHKVLSCWMKNFGK